MRDPNKMAGVNLRFELLSIKSTLNGFLLQMLRSSEVEWWQNN